MPSTYTLISSNVLTGSAASVTFSAIPGTYTDLVLRISTRVDRAITGSHNCLLTVNGSSTSDYSSIAVNGYGVSVDSSLQSATTSIRTATEGDSNTANTFSSNEFYFPNYAGSTNKIASITDVVENNSSADFATFISARAGLRSNTSAITSLTLSTNGYNYKAGSSFYLYGIKNS